MAPRERQFEVTVGFFRPQRAHGLATANDELVFPSPSVIGAIDFAEVLLRQCPPTGLGVVDDRRDRLGGETGGSGDNERRWSGFE